MSFSSSSRSAASSSSSSIKNRSTRLAPKKSLKKSSSPFPNFGSYMAEKTRKLRQQFDADASGSNSGGIFSGVSIFVDGFTVPSSQELKGYMLKHGGRFENYFSRDRVTHIICTNLPDSKMKNLRAFSRGLPVVKPAWILDSLAANKLLGCTPYQLTESVNETSKQRKLSSFFGCKSISSSDGAANVQDPLAKLNVEVSDATNRLISPGGDNFADSRMNGNDESACLPLEKVRQEESSHPIFTDLEDEQSVVEASHSNPHILSDIINDSCTDTNICSTTRSLRAAKQIHSTLGDPNFVENYFKNSRLHFIETWRNRYRRRFCNVQSGAKHDKLDVSSVSGSLKSWIIHIDMDSFFVSVVIRNYPELVDKPVAVCHSDNPKGTAEISSANYPAREYGVRAGMFVRDAKAQCPDLIIVPYDFGAYEEVADQLYSILHNHCSKVQAVSCDEAFLDVTECANDNPEHFASMIRKEIVDTTRCTASAGIAENMLLARLGTKSAKPNGQCFISPEKVDSYLKDLPVKVLPGIGHSIGEKLQNKQIHTCSQLRLLSKEELNKDFGAKTGDLLWNYCRGVDHRVVEVIQEMKSVGAEVNWGVRFNDIADCEHFLANLCKEVSFRLNDCEVEGRTVTLKVKKRRKEAGEPAKYMGCGDCENLSRSMTLPQVTSEMVLLHKITRQIFGSLHVDVKDVRGIGLQITRLESVDSSRKGRRNNALESWLSSYKKTMETGKEVILSASKGGDGHKALYCNVDHDEGKSQKCVSETIYSEPSHVKLSNNAGSHENRKVSLPALCHLDGEVIKNLPPEIFSEMNAMYNGKLSDFMKNYYIEKDRETDDARLSKEIETALSSGSLEVGVVVKRNKTDIGTAPSEPFQGTRSKENHSICSALPICAFPVQSEAEGYRTSSKRSSNQKLFGKFSIIENSERSQSGIGNAPTGCHHRLSTCGSRRVVEKSKCHLWLGNPPKWVEIFKDSSCLLLNVLAEFYTKARKRCNLSSILQSLYTSCPLNLDLINEEREEALSSLCELITEYIDLKIESDIEELYICFRILKRFSLASKLLLEVYNNVLLPLQVSVNELYGGHLQLSFTEHN